MELRNLGRSGLQISPLSLGTMTFGSGNGIAAFGSTPVEAAQGQLDLAIDAGINLIDTADIYSNGGSEEMLGQLLGARRKDLIVATKAFGRTDAGSHGLGSSRRHLIEACEASLRRLKTDWIDLYQLHNFDGLVPLEETLRALDDLISSGKVRYVGCSNFLGWELVKASCLADGLGVNGFVSQQIQYSLLVRDAETEMLPAGVDRGIGALIWSPLAGGYLTGKYRQGDVSDGRVTRLNRLSRFDDERGRRINEMLAEIASGREGVSPGQVALNWLMRRPGVTSVLVGARTVEQLTDNLGAAAWTLSEEEASRLDEASSMPAGYPASQRALFHPERNPPLFRR